MKKIITEIIAFIVSLALILSVCYYIPYVLMPTRKDYGATWSMYTEEPSDSIDVMFLGSSLLYCDVIPAVIYDRQDITSYVLGGGSLSSSIGYYYLKEGLKTQSPDVVMIEATNVFFKKYEEYTKVNIGYMPYGINRLAASLNAAEPEERLGLLFPMYNYHSLWEKHSLSDFVKPRSDEKTDINAGYTYITDVKPQTERKPRIVSKESDIEFNLEYLKKTVDLCRNKGIKVELFLSPSYYYLEEQYKDMLREAVSGVELVDYSDYMDDMGLDASKDFRDSLHLNFYGADKFSAYIADCIADKYDISERSSSGELWQERVENYNSYKTAE